MPSKLRLAIPLDHEHIFLYYNYIKVTATSYGNTLRLFISIPLQSNDREFTIFKVTPWPSPLPYNETFAYTVEPGYQYIALSSDQQKYLHLTQEEADECSQGIKVCSPSSTILYYPLVSCLYALIVHKKTDTCEHKVAKITQPRFQKLSNPNTWVYYSLEPITFTIKCMSP